MNCLWIEEKLIYDGRQLVSHFVYNRYGLMGDVVVAFRGPAKVSLSEMVDLEDVRRVEPIASDEMLHFLVEMFEVGLAQIVWVQRMFVSMLYEYVVKRIGGAYQFERRGDDLFYQERKLSVSIATVSPVSGLIHTALNVVGSGAPLPVASLEELGIDPTAMGKEMVEIFCAEVESILQARTKVRWVN